MISFFFFNDTATTEIYTLSLHDALPISCGVAPLGGVRVGPPRASRPVGRPDRVRDPGDHRGVGDRKSTRLNSSHSQISYAVFCLKKKNKNNADITHHTALRNRSHNHSTI